MYNGVLILDKPQGFTSHDAVAKLRGILRQRRIGHAGTLDPMATGVLVVLLGNATRASDYASGQSKEYIAALRLGVTTDTQDITGTVLQQSEILPPPQALADALEQFTGRQQQLPPMYSAVQVGGKRLYDLARKGIEVERQAREIAIEQMTLLEPEENQPESDFHLAVTCSKGTYIRTLCHDVGQALGCGGCMAALRRVRSGSFTIDMALDFEQVRQLVQDGTLQQHLCPTDAVFSALPAVTLTEEGEKRAKNGAHLMQQHCTDGVVPPLGESCRVYGPDGAFLMTGITKELDKGGAGIFCGATFWYKES